jgi:hypothetical protein
MEEVSGGKGKFEGKTKNDEENFGKFIFMYEAIFLVSCNDSDVMKFHVHKFEFVYIVQLEDRK